MARDDFFLSFGTDADVFANKIQTESERATESIYNLAQALKDYDATLASTKQGGPLSTLFGALDEAAVKFGSLTSELSSTMTTALHGVGSLTSELVNLVDAIEKINDLAPKKKNRTAQGVADITDGDRIATDAARHGKAVGEIIELNATQARNALKRVADINNTVARNSTSAADSLSKLAKQIRELNGAVKETDRRGTVGTLGAGGGGQPIIVMMNAAGQVTGGGSANIELPPNLSALLNSAAQNIAVVEQKKPLTEQQADAQILKNERAAKRAPRPIPDSTAVAESGLYEHPGYEKGRLVGRDVRRGESFQDYFARNDAVRQRISESRAALPKPDHADLADFRQFKNSGAKLQDHEEQEKLTEVFKALQQDTHGSVNSVAQTRAHMDTIAESLKNQYPQLSEILNRILKVREQQIVHAKETLTQIIKADPSATFGGGALGHNNLDFEVGNTFGAALRGVQDDYLKDIPAVGPLRNEQQYLARENRQAQEDQRLVRSAGSQARLGYGQAVPVATYAALPGTPEQVRAEMSLAQRRRDDLRNRRLGLAAGKANVGAYRTENPDNEDVQRLDRLLAQKTLSEGDIIQTLGLKAERTRRPATDMHGVASAVGEWETGLSRQTAFQAGPEQYIAAQKKRAEYRATQFDLAASESSDKTIKAEAEAAAKYERQKGERLTVENVQQSIEQEIHGGRRDFRDLTTDVTHGITPESEAQARQALINQRAKLLGRRSEQSVEDVNSRTVYRGSNEPMDLSRIGPEGIRVTQDRSYAEEHGGKANLYRARIPTSRFRVSDFTGDEEQHATLSREEYEAAQFSRVDEEINTAKTRGPRRSPGALHKNKGTLVAARKRLEELRIQGDQDDAELQGEIVALEREIAALSQARSPKTAAAAGGGGAGKPPPNLAAAAEEEPGEGANKPTAAGAARKPRATSAVNARVDYSAQIDLLSEETKLEIANARARYQTASAIENETARIAAQQRVLTEAGAKFRQDPAFKAIPNLDTKKAVFGQAMGLPPTTANNRTLDTLFTRSGAIDASGLNNNIAKVAAAGGGAATGPGGSIGKMLFGQAGFIDSQFRHIGRALENFAGFQLVFAGFEKLKELVDTGIQADAAFVRLEASVNAAGRSVGDMKIKLQSISSGTATELDDTIQAASELNGVFSDNTSLLAATRVATELSNISEGSLTAKEAAVALRDVIDAFGLTGTDSVRSVGDQVTRLSQTTGVAVEDILKGTAQLAQISSQYGLSQRQTSVLSAYVTRSTGETGAAAGEQVSRILSTFDNGKVQSTLQNIINPKTGKPLATPEQFSKGKTGEVLGNVLGQYDELTPGQQSQIRFLIGSGRQARALAGLFRDASAAAKEFNGGQEDMGALASQNEKFLASLAGVLKSLKTDFANLGASLADSGFFNIIGLFAKSLDEVLKITAKIINSFNALANASPFTKGIKDVGILLAQVGLLFKISAGGIGSILGKFRPATFDDAGKQTGGRQFVGLAGANQPITFGKDGRPEGSYSPLRARELAAGPQGVLGFAGRSYGVRSTGRAIGGFVNPSAASLGLEEGTGFGTRSRAALNQRGNSILRTLTGGQLGNPGVPRVFGPQTQENAAAAEAIAATKGTTLATRQFGTGLIGTMASLALFGYLLSKITGAAQGEQDTDKSNKEKLKGLTGETAAEEKARAEGKGPDPKAEAARAEEQKARGRSSSPIGQAVANARNAAGGRNVGSTDIHDDAEYDRQSGTTNKYLAALGRNAQRGITAAGSDKDKLALADDNLETQYAKGLKQIEADAKAISEDKTLNPTQKAQGIAELELAKANFKKRYDALKSQAQGINEIDRLNITQLQGLQAALGQSQSITAETLQGAIGDKIKQTILDNAGLPIDSEGYKALQASLDVGNETETDGAYSPGGSVYNSQVPKAGRETPIERGITERRLRNEKRAADEAVRQAQLGVDTSGKSDGIGSPAQKLAITAWEQAIQTQQQATQALRGFEIDTPGGLATNQLAGGNRKGAITNLKKSVTALEDANKVLPKDSAEYIGNLKKIHDLKTQIGDLQYEGAVLIASAIAARSNDPAIKARAELDKAIALQKAVLSREHTASEGQQAQAAVDAATIGVAQTGEEGKATRFQTSIAGHVDNATKANQELNEILRQQASAASGTLASQVHLTQLKGNEAELRQKLAQIANDTINATAETQIAELQARGQAGDLEKAADLQAAGVGTQMRQYLAKPGASKSDPEYIKLQGQQATANRSAFDTKLQLRLETLDYEKETNKITASQEIQALKEILKNKQLTLKEQRDITLKIKGLQGQVNQMWNMPNDIKMPTPYEMKRVLKTQMAGADYFGAGAADAGGSSLQKLRELSGGSGASATVITTNSNNTSVSISGADVMMIKTLLTQLLGPKVTQRTTASTTAKKN